MTEDRKRDNFASQTGNSWKGRWSDELKPAAALFRWLLSVSLFALVILVVSAFFQMQLVALQRELATLKLNFSRWEEEKWRNLKKRSASDSEDEMAAGGGMQAAHLQGGVPFQHVQKQGTIGPWSASASDNTFIALRKKNTEIEISQNGVYYVYAQVYYLTSEPHNRFQILSHNGTEERKHHRNLITCSTPGRNFMGEVSCYTGFTGSFHSGQRLYLNQIEQNRIIRFTNGCSFFGVVLLKKNAAFKPVT